MAGSRASSSDSSKVINAKPCSCSSHCPCCDQFDWDQLKRLLDLLDTKLSPSQAAIADAKTKTKGELDVHQAENATLKAKNDSLTKKLNAPKSHDNEMRDTFLWNFVGCFASLYLAFRLSGETSLCYTAWALLVAATTLLLVIQEDTISKRREMRQI
ncbi:hypothetical protein K491DRAFT_683087 [Lophiostoma macrostomum CBS 122681]|uniref:Uncharacterized protein n=1 Tax=Lophiostoma macrostomum CBS 122681 TaxID=1314788 RepID=A0A6A6SRN5_9PLEO|nr:hypothetical protein K491DRAFT_683087 [Lophiostoma macrostomum CBS 122681]